jgi:hypothetical protein
MRSMLWNWAYATNGGTASVQFNVPSGYYVIAEGALTATRNSEGPSPGEEKVGIISYTPPTGPPVNFGDKDHWATYIDGPGILNVTFGAYADPYKDMLAVLNVFLW